MGRNEHLGPPPPPAVFRHAENEIIASPLREIPLGRAAAPLGRFQLTPKTSNQNSRRPPPLPCLPVLPEMARLRRQLHSPRIAVRPVGGSHAGFQPVGTRREINLRDRDRQVVQQRGLTADERKFLVSVKSGAPDWALLPIPGIDRLPAIQWKLTNISRMDPSKRAEMLAKLKAKLGL